MEYMSDQIGDLAAALAAAQMELEPASKNATNPMLRNRYADLASCYEACRKTLPKHDLAVSQIILPAEAGRICVKTMLLHKSGQWLASECTLESMGNKGVNAAQAAGSAITYARRYGLSAIVGLVADDDDDGCTAAPTSKEKVQNARAQAAASNPNPASPELAKALMTTLTKRVGHQGSEEKTRAAYLAELSGVFGREIKSSKELTQAEIREYLDAVNGLNYNPDNPF